MKSEFLRLNRKDFWRGLVMAVGMVVWNFVGNLMVSGKLPESTSVLIVSAGAAILYIGKNFFTNSNDDLGKKEPPSRGMG